MTRKKSASRFSKKEARERFEAALRGSRNVNPQAKPTPMKRGRSVRDEMPKDDAEALIEWGKRNIQK
jgi:hypothetical protein